MSGPFAPGQAGHDSVVRWLVPNRVIYMRAVGNISPSMRTWMNTQAVYLYHSCATPKIHLFIDGRQVSQRSRAKRQDQTAIWHPRRGWCLSMGAIRSPVLRALLNPLMRLMRTRVQDFSSEDAALAFLQDADPTLPDLKPYWEAIKRQQAPSDT